MIFVLGIALWIVLPCSVLWFALEWEHDNDNFCEEVRKELKQLKHFFQRRVSK